MAVKKASESARRIVDIRPCPMDPDASELAADTHVVAQLKEHRRQAGNRPGHAPCFGRARSHCRVCRGGR